MVIELIIGSVFGVAYVYGGVSLLRAIHPRKRETKVKQNLLGTKIGVAAFEPNGSVHDLEGEVMNAVLEAGGRCVTTNRKLIRELVKGLDVCGEGNLLVNADLLLAITVIETAQQLERSIGVGFTPEFVVWVKHRFPKAVFDQSGRMHFYSDDLIRSYYRTHTSTSIQKAYEIETKQLSTSQLVEKTARLSMNADFRCYSPAGEVMGAGTLSRELADATQQQRLTLIRQLASEIVNRIHVSKGDAGIEVWYGDARGASRIVPTPSAGGGTVGQLMLPPGEKE